MDLKNYFKTASTNYIYTRPCELNWILVTHGWMQITANLVWSVLPPTLFPPFGYLILNSFKNQNTHEKRLAILENYYPFLEWIQMKSIIWNLNFMFTYEKQQSIFVLNQFTSDGVEIPEHLNDFFFNNKDFFYQILWNFWRVFFEFPQQRFEKLWGDHCSTCVYPITQWNIHELKFGFSVNRHHH